MGRKLSIEMHAEEFNQTEVRNMSVISMKQLLEAGVHFGHQTRRWNPKMAPYIFTERNGIHTMQFPKSQHRAAPSFLLAPRSRLRMLLRLRQNAAECIM